MNKLEETILKNLPAAIFERKVSSKKYHEKFRASGQEKGENALQTLRKLNVDLSRCAYFSVGGSFGSEIAWVMDNSKVSHGVLLEYDPAVVLEVTKKVRRFKRDGKDLRFVPGDATQQIDACRRVIEEWRDAERIHTVVCSVQAVFHELPTRSPNFHLPNFLYKMLAGPHRRIFICREPCAPVGWPDRVELSVQRINPEIIEALTVDIARKLDFKEIVRRTGDFVEMSNSLAVETLFKIYYADDMQHELEERITIIDPAAFTIELEQHLGITSVSRVHKNSRSFETKYRELGVQARDPKTKAALSMPVAFCEFVGDSRAAIGADAPIARSEKKRLPAAKTQRSRSSRSRKGAVTHRFLRRRCRVMPPGSEQFRTIIRSMLSRRFDQAEAMEHFHTSWRALPRGYEREMTHAAYLESIGQIEEMRDVLEKSRFEDPTRNAARLLYLALAYEKLDDLPRAKDILRGILDSEKQQDIIRAAQFNLHVCYEKEGAFEKTDFAAFIEDREICFVDGERLSDKAVAMHLILCIEKEQPLLYKPELEESLAFLFDASKTGYVKTFLTKIAYEETDLPPKSIDTILSQINVMDQNSRVSILTTLYKYLPKHAVKPRDHILELLRAKLGKSNTVSKWLKGVKR